MLDFLYANPQLSHILSHGNASYIKFNAKDNLDIFL